MVLPRLRALPVIRRYPATAVVTAVRARGLRDDFRPVRSFLLFVGHPRSGHSLVGALIDAHPNALVAHELDALKYVEAGFGRDQLYTLILRHQRARAADGLRSGSGYAYAVPGQWQGRYQRLEVIGDKKGGRSTMRLASQLDLFDRLTSAVGVPVKVVQVVRNPYDNIATMFRRGHRRPLSEHADNYFELATTVRALRERIDADHFHELRLETLIAEPTTTLTRLTGFLGLDASPDYLAASGAVVFPTARRTRTDAPWTPELLDLVARRASEHPGLDGYGFAEAVG
ncbi:MAG: sulfotransferase [Acidimicrobiales bacterium]